jgi:hypothetical protein
MEEIKKHYLSLLTEIIAKESIILGKDIAILKAQGVGALVLDASGNVINIKGDANQILHKLIDEYVDLIGNLAKDTINPIFAKYPLIKI